MRCNPECWGCRAVGACPDEQAGQSPAVSASTPHQWTPDQLTGQRAGCGHVIPIIPIIRDWFSIKEVWCEECNRWVKPPPKKKTTTKRKREPPPGQEELIPF